MPTLFGGAEQVTAAPPAVARALAGTTPGGPAVAAIPPNIVGEVQNDVSRIRAELDSVVYTDGVEEAVLGILYRWSQHGSLRESTALLESIFDGLQVPTHEWFHSRTYYDAMLDRFRRADEVRRLRDSTRKYSGRESSATRDRLAEEEKERRETDVAASAAGHWTEDVASEYELPRTPQNRFLVALVINRLSRIPEERQTPGQRALSMRIAREGPDVLLKAVHFASESERIEQRKAAARAVVTTMLEFALWMTAEKLLTLAVDAVLASLAESAAVRATTAVVMPEAAGLAVAGTEVGAERALVRLAGSEGEVAAVGEGSALITDRGYGYRIVELDRTTGEAAVIGRDLASGEQATVRMNVDTGSGTATRTATGDVIAIQNGHVTPVQPALGAEAAGEAAKTGAPPGTQSGKGKKVVFIDSTVISEVAKGNVALQEQLERLIAEGADVRVPRPAYTEITRGGNPEGVAAREAVVQRMGIKIDEGVELSSRLPSYSKAAQEDIRFEGLNVSAKQTKETGDLVIGASAKAADAELWTLDNRSKTALKQLGVKLFEP